MAKDLKDFYITPPDGIRRKVKGFTLTDPQHPSGVVWHDTWKVNLNIGNYVTKIKYSTDNTNWIETESNVEVEIDWEDILYVKAVTYEDDTNNYVYTDHNMDSQFNNEYDGETITVYRDRAIRYYTTTVNAGNYISTLKAKAGSSGTWTAANSRVTVTHTYNQTIYWELVSYNTSDVRYIYSGDTSGSFNGAKGTTETINRIRTLRSYTLTFLVTNGSYGTYSITRTPSSSYHAPAAETWSNVANNTTRTIYYGDKLTTSHSQNADSAISWGSWGTVVAPTVTSNGSATSGNITVTNKDSESCTLYYQTANSGYSGTSLGLTATNASQTQTGLTFGADYYCYATKTVGRSGSHYTYSDTSTYSGTNAVSDNVSATFTFGRSSVADSETKTGYSDLIKHTIGNQTTYTITFTRKRQPSSAAQTLGNTVNDSSIGVASVTVPYGGDYSETFSKTNYVSQTKSGTNITADVTVVVNLLPDTVAITQTDISNASESLNFSWAYKDNSYVITQTVTPNTGYDYTANNVRYYNGKSYTRTITSPAATSFGDLTMNKFTYTVSGNGAVNGTTSWTGDKQIGDNVTWTITADDYYAAPSPATGTKTISSTNFTLNEANKTAVYKGSSLGTCTAYKYSIQSYSITGGTVYWSTSQITTSGGSTTLSDVSYNTTVYWRIAASTGYDKPSTYYGSMTLNDTNFTISSKTSSGTATYKGSDIADCSRKSFTITFTDGTYGSWSKASITAYYGDTISRSSNTINIYKWDASTTKRDSSTYTLPSDTAQYSYSTSYPTLTTPITSDQTIKPTDSRSDIPYPVSITAGTGIKSVFLSTNSSATSGSSSGTSYDYGTTVYAFAKLDEGYNSKSGWTKVSGTADSENAIYRVDSVTVDGTEDFGTIAANIKTFTITVNKNAYTSDCYVKLNNTTKYSGGNATTFTASYWDTVTVGINKNKYKYDVRTSDVNASASATISGSENSGYNDPESTLNNKLWLNINNCTRNVELFMLSSSNGTSWADVGSLGTYSANQEIHYYRINQPNKYIKFRKHMLVKGTKYYYKFTSSWDGTTSGSVDGKGNSDFTVKSAATISWGRTSYTEADQTESLYGPVNSDSNVCVTGKKLTATWSDLSHDVLTANFDVTNTNTRINGNGISAKVILSNYQKVYPESLATSFREVSVPYGTTKTVVIGRNSIKGSAIARWYFILASESDLDSQSARKTYLVDRGNWS